MIVCDDGELGPMEQMSTGDDDQKDLTRRCYEWYSSVFNRVVAAGILTNQPPYPSH